MGNQNKTELRVPQEKLALVIGVNDYSLSKGWYKNQTYPAKNAYEVIKLLKKHDYQVHSNINNYEEESKAKGSSMTMNEIKPVLDEFLSKGKTAYLKRKFIHFFVYFSGIVVKSVDTEEIIGIDSEGNIFPLDRYCKSLAQCKHTFTVFVVDGVMVTSAKKYYNNHFEKCPKMTMSQQPYYCQLEDANIAKFLKKGKGQCVVFKKATHEDWALTIPPFIMSRPTYKFITYINKQQTVVIKDLHEEFKDSCLLIGRPLKEWKMWKLFKDSKIKVISFKGNKKYQGQVQPPDDKLTGYGIFKDEGNNCIYEGEFLNGDFWGYGSYLWKNEKQYYEGEWKKMQYGKGIMIKENGIRYEGDFKFGRFDGYGVGVFPNGEKYDGNWWKDKAHGYGIMHFEDGGVFEGQFEDGKMNGSGTFQYKAGHKYEGEFKHGLKHGNGMIKFKNGDVFIGQFENGVKEGQGEMLWNDGRRYHGRYQKGKINGEGYYEKPGELSYQGMFKDGQFHGKGTCTFSNGEVYSGEWDNGVMKEGKQKLLNGEIYEGELKSNVRCGYGKLTLPTGEVIEGSFFNGQITGEGTITFGDEYVYEGQLRKTIPNGSGNLKKKGGYEYEGRFTNGKQNGQGVETIQDLLTFEGQFKEGKRNGEGLLTLNNGTKLTGTWIEDSLNGNGVIEFDNGRKLEAEFQNDEIIKETAVITHNGSKQFQGEWQLVLTKTDIKLLFDREIDDYNDQMRNEAAQIMAQANVSKEDSKNSDDIPKMELLQVKSEISMAGVQAGQQPLLSLKSFSSLRVSFGFSAEKVKNQDEEEEEGKEATTPKLAQMRSQQTMFNIHDFDYFEKDVEDSDLKNNSPSKSTKAKRNKKFETITQQDLQDFQVEKEIGKGEADQYDDEFKQDFFSEEDEEEKSDEDTHEKGNDHEAMEFGDKNHDDNEYAQNANKEGNELQRFITSKFSFQDEVL